MHCNFTTNIDCCKRFMGKISGMDIDPQVGDHVIVYADSKFELKLQVISRTWNPYKSQRYVTCELHLPSWIPNIATLEGILRNNHFIS